MEKVKFKEYLKERVTHKFFIATVAVYSLFCIVSAVYFGVVQRPRDSLLSIAYMAFAVAVFLAEFLIGFRCGELFTVALLSLATGGLLGTCYDVYTLIPCFDTLLHGLSGVLFGCLGFMLADKFFDGENGGKAFFGKLIFAVCFSLAIAVVWEIYEYTCTKFFGFDMMEDAYVDRISSYFLSGTHAETVDIDGIFKTVIYYGNGQTYTLDGYLDLGLIDTLNDMIVCTVGALVFAFVSTVSYFKCPKINRILIPQNVKRKTENA